MANDEANANVIITNHDSLTGQESEVVQGVSQILADDKLRAIICVAGGWAGGSAASKGIF